MRFSLQVHYAICGVFDLAYNGQGDPVQVRVIGERQEIPVRYLEQIFQRLRRAELVNGKRGPGGGYILARKTSEISLRNIIEAVEGPVGGQPSPIGGSNSAEFSLSGGGSANRPDFVWDQLAERFTEVLSDLTLEDLCRQAAQRGVRRCGAEVHNYQI